VKRWLLRGGLLLAAACARSSPPQPASGERRVEALLAVAEEARTELGAELPTRERAREALERTRTAARERVRGRPGAQAIDALNGLLFEELGFEREVPAVRLEQGLLPRVAVERRGSCVGLASLYLVLAADLDLPVQAVLAPGHLFLRYSSTAERRNIELLRGGEAVSDAWYQERYRVQGGCPAYLRPLSEAELVAAVRFNLANHYRLRSQWTQAEKTYRGVIAAFPDFAEAHANLGLTLQLLGRSEAAAVYERARGACPGLPGLEANLTALKSSAP
jgi:regulator of sirC expression with transglutaminase-like and TPR domain